MTRRHVLLGLSALALASCATAPPRPPAAISPGPGPAELEAVFAVSADGDGLTVRVSSNGCTRKEDFAFYVERKGAATTVAFARKRLDRCRSFARGHADLAFSYAELGLSRDTPVFVLNPFVGF
jgi:hypothetical protein